MLVLWGKVIRPEPSTMVVSFVAWSTVVGVSLVVPGNAFELSPAWSSLQAIHASDREWGVAMMVDALLLCISLRMRTIPYRAAITVFSAIMWTLLGISMVWNAWSAGFVSIAGVYSVWCALQALLCVGKWFAEDYDNGDR